MIKSYYIICLLWRRLTHCQTRRLEDCHPPYRVDGSEVHLVAGHGLGDRRGSVEGVFATTFLAKRYVWLYGMANPSSSSSSSFMMMMMMMMIMTKPPLAALHQTTALYARFISLLFLQLLRGQLH